MMQNKAEKKQYVAPKMVVYHLEQTQILSLSTDGGTTQSLDNEEGVYNWNYSE